MQNDDRKLTLLKGVYGGMMGRCYYPGNPGYKNYGERGIKICADWYESFESFYKWALSNGYEIGLTIDRIDVDGNYEPANCRWVDRKTQANNKRNNRFKTYKGETHTIAEWAEIYNLPKRVLYKRLVFLKWDMERAVSTPVKNNKFQRL